MPVQARVDLRFLTWSGVALAAWLPLASLLYFNAARRNARDWLVGAGGQTTGHAPNAVRMAAFMSLVLAPVCAGWGAGFQAGQAAYGSLSLFLYLTWARVIAAIMSLALAGLLLQLGLTLMRPDPRSAARCRFAMGWALVLWAMAAVGCLARQVAGGTTTIDPMTVSLVSAALLLPLHAWMLYDSARALTRV